MTDEPLRWDEFQRVELRVGTVVRAEAFDEARDPAYILHVDFGEPVGTLKSSAQITGHYSTDELLGAQVIAVVNFPPKQIGPLMSQCLVTGFHDAEGEVVLARPDIPVPNGTRLL